MKNTTITLEQQRRVDSQTRASYLYKYLVVSLVNITEPRIGDMLTQSQVNSLISNGHKIVIKEERA